MSRRSFGVRHRTAADLDALQAIARLTHSRLQ
jgi:hypothetical protein